jgi:chloramphenicol 3-O-phosphotransferase
MHELIRGMHRAVAALADNGTSVVVDHVLWEDAWYEDCAFVLPSALFVGVRCSKEVLIQRPAHPSAAVSASPSYQLRHPAFGGS